MTRSALRPVLGKQQETAGIMPAVFVHGLN